jgi:hypothetical protein
MNLMFISKASDNGTMSRRKDNMRHQTLEAHLHNGGHGKSHDGDGDGDVDVDVDVGSWSEREHWQARMVTFLLNSSSSLVLVGILVRGSRQQLISVLGFTGRVLGASRALSPYKQSYRFNYSSYV